MAGRTYEGKVVRVTGGDTFELLTIKGRLAVRLAEIEAPGRGQPWGRQARMALAGKIAQRVVIVDQIYVDRHGRVVGQVWLGERYINRELLEEGHVWAYPKYLVDDSLLGLEVAAKAAGKGLWALP